MEETEKVTFPELQTSLLKLNYEAIIGRAGRLSSNLQSIAETDCIQKSAGLADALITPAGGSATLSRRCTDRERTAERRSEYELFALKSIKQIRHFDVNSKIEPLEPQIKSAACFRLIFSPGRRRGVVTEA